VKTIGKGKKFLGKCKKEGGPGFSDFVFGMGIGRERGGETLYLSTSNNKIDLITPLMIIY
tara:strand:- start:249 stop:428 length:180 start_codon:yes stop_codon:yes gene_type:complete